MRREEAEPGRERGGGRNDSDLFERYDTVVSSGWFGHQQEARVAVWLEIDRHAAAENVKDAGEIHSIWQDNKSKQFISGVEAGHEGPCLSV